MKTAVGGICESLTGAYSDLRHLASAHPIDLHAIGLSPAAIERLTDFMEFVKRIILRGTTGCATRT